MGAAQYGAAPYRFCSEEMMPKDPNRLDESKSYMTVHGGDVPYRYIQDGAYFNGEKSRVNGDGTPYGGEKPKAPEPAVAKPQTSPEGARAVTQPTPQPAKAKAGRKQYSKRAPIDGSVPYESDAKAKPMQLRERYRFLTKRVPPAGADKEGVRKLILDYKAEVGL